MKKNYFCIHNNKVNPFNNKCMQNMRINKICNVAVAVRTKLWEDKIWRPKIKHSLAQYIVKQRFIKTKYSGGRYHTSLPPCWWEAGKWWRMLPSSHLQSFRVRATRRQIPGKFPEHPLQQRSSPQQQQQWIQAVYSRGGNPNLRKIYEPRFLFHLEPNS